MVTLTEEMIIARTKISNLESITKLNFCSRELSDVSILQKMKNVTVLSLSVNNIDSLEVFQFLTKLEDLFLRKNNIADLNQVCYLQSLPELQNLWLQDNPCAANDEEYRLAVIRALPRLKKLDNAPVESSEIERAQRMGRPLAHPSVLESQADRSPSPEEEYHQEKNNFSPEPPANMPPRTKEFNNSYETMNNGGYPHEVEDTRETFIEQSENRVYQNHRSQAPAYIKYEDEMPPQRQPNHRPQGMLPRSRTRTNVLNAVLCLIKELDYPNLEVVHMAVKCRMEDLCSDQLPIQ